jgi:hypothetical protein
VNFANGQAPNCGKTFRCSVRSFRTVTY